MTGVFRRLYLLKDVACYDFIFIHRESLPVGPPVLEWIMIRLFKKKVIYDFDDAIWIENSSDTNRFFAPLKSHAAVFPICRWAYKISVGNEYLKNAVLPYNRNVVINPTTIDTANYHNKMASHTNDPPVLGWTGSHSTNKYLYPFFEIIKKLKESHQFRFVVISDTPPSGHGELFEFIQWNKQTEIDDLLKFDIGVMPLSHDPWSEGKCGFKALQYMSLGIPAIVSAVGVNEKIVDDGINGFVCRTDQQWLDKLKYLLENKQEIIKMGLEARKKIISDFSVDSNISNFIHLFS